MIKCVWLWLLAVGLVACGSQQATPTPIPTTLPESIFLQPIDQAQVTEEEPFFKFSPHSDNIIEGQLVVANHRDPDLKIEAVKVRFYKLPNRQELLTTTISEKIYPVHFTTSAILY